MNKTILLGRLTKDPERRETATSNTEVSNFTLAVNRRFKQEGQPEADFINIVAFGKTATFCNLYFKKGLQVYVVGRLQTRNWTDDNGQIHYVTEVIADEVYFADSKKTDQSNQTQTDTSNMTDLQYEAMLSQGVPVNLNNNSQVDLPF